jgi:hypothetical protein
MVIEGIEDLRAPEASLGVLDQMVYQVNEDSEEMLAIVAHQVEKDHVAVKEDTAFLEVMEDTVHVLEETVSLVFHIKKDIRYYFLLIFKNIKQFLCC